MEQRKNPEKDLRKSSGLFFQIGLLIAMGLAVSAFEYRTYDADDVIVVITGNNVEDPPVPITEIPPPKPPKPVLATPVAIPDDEVIEDIDEEIIFDIEELPEDIPEPIVVEESEEEVKQFYDYVEEAPTPIGGYEAFYKFINKNIKYPAQARRMGLGGKVFVRFIIDPSGNITEVETIKGVGAGLDKEAMRVLAKSPAWKPGRQGGRRVSVRMVIPITFELGK